MNTSFVHRKTVLADSVTLCKRARRMLPHYRAASMLPSSCCLFAAC
jgi:hypothetical protein